MAMTPEQEPPTYDGGSPYKPPADFPEYPNDGGFNEWTLDENPFPGEEEGPQVPRVLTAKFKSSSRQAEVFLHDPVSALTGADGTGITSPLSRSDVPENPFVTTLVINHHRTLAKHIIRAKATVDDESVGITIHKEERPGS